jgi:hypothetical protein
MSTNLAAEPPACCVTKLKVDATMASTFRFIRSFGQSQGLAALKLKTALRMSRGI